MSVSIFHAPETAVFLATGGGEVLNNEAWLAFCVELEHRGLLMVDALETCAAMADGDPEELRAFVDKALRTWRRERTAWTATCSVCHVEHVWIEQENSGGIPTGLDIICPVCIAAAQSPQHGRLTFRRCV